MDPEKNIKSGEVENKRKRNSFIIVAVVSLIIVLLFGSLYAFSSNSEEADSKSQDKSKLTNRRIYYK
jgi:flagellar basal body-associated protein FliL